ncbi:MAG: hypothetical protein ACI4D8_02475 [Wujia sp.]
MKNRKRCYIILGVLAIIILSCVIVFKKLSYIRGPAFVLINGYTSGFYKALLIMVIVVAVIGMLCIRIILKANKTIGFRIRLGIEIGIALLIMASVAVNFVKNMDDYRRKPYQTSPDGMHSIYEDGGDRDIFGNTSGYMHYARPISKYGYARVFYCYEDEFTPQIEWYEDGFLVKYSCPEADESYNHGVHVCPESYLSSPFVWEKRADGYFFYYYFE